MASTPRVSSASRTLELALRGAGGEPVDLWRTIVSHGTASLPPAQIDVAVKVDVEALAKELAPRVAHFLEVERRRRHREAVREVVRALPARGATVAEVAAELDIPESRVSQALRVAHARGDVARTKRGRRYVYKPID